MVVRVLVALGVACLATVGGLAVSRWRARESAPGTRDPIGEQVTRSLIPHEARGGWAVLAFTSPLCQACKRTPGIVAEALGVEPGALDEGLRQGPRFERVDVREHPVLAGRLGVRSTPAVVVLDPEGRVRFHRSGNPAPDALASSLPTQPGGATA